MSAIKFDGERWTRDGVEVPPAEAAHARVQEEIDRLGPRDRTDTAPDGTAEFRDLFGHPGQSWTQP